jgi:peptidyl-prolyl cis-trans isomerase B (cyclophilin B)
MPLIRHCPALALIFALAVMAMPQAVAAQEEGEPTPEAEDVIEGDTAETPAETAKEKAKPGGNPVVLMKTSMGDVKIKLNKDKAPISVANFLSYVDEKFYDGTIFHRVIKDFMVQGGGYTADFSKKETKAAIKNEAQNGLSNKRGTVAMARTNIVDSATSQFFINVVDNSFLDHKNPTREFGYAVFGEVTDGMDVVDKIRGVKTGAKGPFATDCPAEPVTIISIRRVEG